MSDIKFKLSSAIETLIVANEYLIEDSNKNQEKIFEFDYLDRGRGTRSISSFRIIPFPTSPCLFSNCLGNICFKIKLEKHSN